MGHDTAAIVTVGSELVEGLRVDTNTAEIARALAASGFKVAEAVSVGDDVHAVSAVLERLTRDHALVITTGGLGPTHDDVTRESAAEALGVTLVRDARLEALLEPLVARHRDSEAGAQVLSQADVVPGSRVIDPTTGTAPGLVIPTRGGSLALLPGPPSEMRPMLEAVLEPYASRRAAPADLGVVGLSESDVQLRAQRALTGHPGVVLTVLAKPGDVRVILFDDGAGEEGISRAREDVCAALEPACYTTTGQSLPAAVLEAARTAGVTFSLAESCTGGMAASDITSVPGASDVFAGSAVTYANAAKSSLLGVDADLIAHHGAVSEETARAMAEGARMRFGTTLCAAVTGVAGPDGGTANKPVGTVWFAVSGPRGTRSLVRHFPSTSSRDAIRQRSVATALDLLRTQIATISG